ncbi:ABC-2 family transporter protein [Alteribacillus persepolensis]|uniref:ABC-2 family transporter protein n=1 Tax=Alteribacillus persepolensis TaxID=568899 RepID=A0A1G8IPC4_9BACI|nr:ABC transporter permease subunit [Alteribacillus persepolensis]SDI20888.1 ABC-2 family transporter protein [Alteribacillus persepolensis]
MNLIKLEILLLRRSFIIGGGIILFFTALLGSLADYYLNNAELLEAVEQFPDAVIEGFGFHVSVMTSFEGWTSGQIYTYYVLLLGCFAAMWACASIVKDRDMGTDEFLYSLPYSRLHVYFSRVAAQLFLTSTIFLLTFLITVACGFLFSQIESVRTIFFIMLAGYFIVLAFSGIGYILTTLLHSERSAMSAGVGIVMISFLLNMMAGMDETVSWLSYFSLFYVFDTKALVHGDGLSISAAAATLGIYIAGTALGAFLFKRQDVVR